jgi:hypothetical protein
MGTTDVEDPLVLDVRIKREFVDEVNHRQLPLMCKDLVRLEVGHIDDTPGHL